MAKTKYGKYFVSGEEKGKEHILPNKVISYLDGEIFPGCNFFLCMMIPPNTPNHSDYFGKSWGKFSTHPHTHTCAEVLMFLGTNPDDITDLGGEIELCMGEEMEPHTITKSTTVFIPAGLIHCPWTIKRVDRPIIFVQALQEPHQFVKSYEHMLSDDEKDYFLSGGMEYGKAPAMRPPKKLRP